jgi:hypothetical protein
MVEGGGCLYQFGPLGRGHVTGTNALSTTGHGDASARSAAPVRFLPSPPTTGDTASKARHANSTL